LTILVKYDIINVVANETTLIIKWGCKMGVSTEILKARKLGVREFKEHVSKKLLGGLLVITDRSKPISVNVPYDELLELVDILDELSDRETLSIIAKGREAIDRGEEGIPVEEVFERIKAKRKK
jgi:hypothetical protein